jgi:hypothetical protein
LNYPDQQRLRLTPRQIAVRRYFTPAPKFPVRAMIGPGVAGLVGLLLLASGSIGVVIGLILIIIALVKAVPRVRRYIRACALSDPKPADHELDVWLAEAIGPIVEDGFTRLDIVRSDLVNNDMQPLVIVGFPRDLPGSAAPRPGQRHDDQRMGFRLARGVDGKIRATHYDILVVYLTKWRLCTYQGLLEMETGKVIADGTREFLYRDVVSVATEGKREKIQVPDDHTRRPSDTDPQSAAASSPKAENSATFELTTSQWFRLRVASDEISVLVALFDVSAYGEGTDIDIALRQIRGRLRDYAELREEGTGAFDDLHAARHRGTDF